jgi:predicted Zn-dependent protease
VLVAGTGCGMSLAPSANRPDAWVSRLGGAAVTADLPRVEAAAERLVSGAPRRLSRFLVAAHDRVGAWSWSDGSVVLTQRLLASLSDDELTAVLAHELGHLELDARTGRRALAGNTRGSAAEDAADDAGCKILARAGMDPTLMPGMLRHVAALESVDTKAGRSALRRATRLEVSCRCAR